MLVQPTNVTGVLTMEVLYLNSIPNESDVSCSYIDFREALGDTHYAYPIHTHTGFPKIFVLKGDGPVKLSPLYSKSHHTPH